MNEPGSPQPESETAHSPNAVVNFCRRAIASRWFQLLVTSLILISALIVGLDIDPAVPDHRIFGIILDGIAVVFVFEIGVRIVAEFPRPHRFFKSPWNLFDFIVVLLCLLPGASKVSLVLRLGRVVRVLRVVTVVPGLRVIVAAMLDSLPAVGNVVFLLMLHFYVYAVIGVALFGQNDPGHFATIARSMLTLFGVLTLEGWVDVMYTEMLGNSVHASSIPLPEAVNHAAPLLGPLYFVTFILIGTIVFMNLFVGVVVNAIQEAHEAAAKGQGGDSTNQAASVAPGKPASTSEELRALEEQLDTLKGRVSALRGKLDPPNPTK